MQSLNGSPSVEFTESPRARVIRHVTRAIQEGVYGDGQPLPPERVLAQQVGVNQRTVSSALEMLAEQGVIRSNGGRLRLVAARNGPRSEVMQNAVVLLKGAEDLSRAHLSHSTSMVRVAYSAQCAIEDAGYNAVVLHPSQLNGSMPRSLAADSPRGVLIPEMALWTDPESVTDLALELQSHGLNVVVNGDGTRLSGFDRVISDHEAGAYALTRRLLERGRRRIVPVEVTMPDDREIYWLSPRRAGYLRAMQEAGLEALLPVMLDGQLRYGGGLDEYDKAVRHCVGYLAQHLTGQQPADAFMAVSDFLVHFIAPACRLCHKEPGVDVLIAGYDNYWSRYPDAEWELSRPDATMDKLNPQTGDLMVQLLLARINGDLPPEPQLRMVTPRLIDPSAGEPHLATTFHRDTALAATGR